MFLDDLLNGARFQVSAPLADVILFTRPWGFDAADVQVPVHWWHGDSDHIIPHAHGVHMAERLPHARFTTIHGESHLGGLGVATEVLSAADGARTALDSPRHLRHKRHAEAAIRGVRLARSAPFSHNGLTSSHAPHSAQTGLTLLHLSRPLGKAYLDAGARGGPCSDSYRDPWSPLRPLGAVRAVPARRVGRGRRTRRRPADRVDPSACPGRHLPHRVLLGRRPRHRGGHHLGPARLEPPALRGHRGVAPPAPRAPASPRRPTSASSTPSPACTATS